MNSIKPCEAFHVVSEPGDGTHYEFLVSTVPDQPESLWIASASRGGGCPVFIGYAYAIDSLIEFGVYYQSAIDGGSHAYRSAAEQLETHPLIKYASELGHSSPPSGRWRLNPWTAIAGLIAGYRVAKLLTKEER
ncbi:MAG TPA: hypothetical protein VGB13_04465 [Candidatus Krumholzibacteria bacterium]